MQRAFRAREFDTAGTWLQRLVYRVRYYRFYLYAPLYLGVIVFLVTSVRFREYRSLWVALTVLIFALGTNFYPIFLTHYIAGICCLLILMSVEGLRRLNASAARAVIYLCVAQFAFSYSIHLFEDRELAAWETGDFINHGNPERRIEINRQLGPIPGKLLVFVRYWPQHIFQEEWVYNEADIDRARVVWARDLGDSENGKLMRYYPDRAVLLLEPDARPVRLGPWKPEPPKAPDKAPEKPKEKPVPKIPFEPVI
jgi:hypothetical protein